MRQDEELCKETFTNYLTNRFGLVLPSKAWIPGPDPPDYYLLLEGRKFAVEVTTIMGAVGAGSARIPDKGYRVSRFRLAKKIEELATRRGILKGHYSIIWNGPFIKSEKSLVETKVLDYIQKTKDLCQSPAEEVLREDEIVCEISKLGSDRNKVSITITAPEWHQFEGEISDDMCRLLEDAISDKREKLKTELLPKILLLIHSYRLGDPRIYLQCKKSLSCLDFFHSVFIVAEQNDGYFLHSKESAWAVLS